MTTAKKFASQADLDEKKVTFEKLSDNAYAYTAEGDPNTGIVIGDDAVLVADTQATPVMAQDVIRRIRKVTDKPIKYVVLTHYHAVRVLGASAYKPDHIIVSHDTYELIKERGEAGHSKGDTVVWLPQQKILFSGDLVEYGATPYAGDAYFKDWPHTLDALAALKPEKLVPGRGDALKTPAQVNEGIEGTRAFTSELFAVVKKGAAAGKELGQVYKETYAALKPKYGHWVIFDHCMPFDVSRAYDEATQYVDPRVWTAQRDKELWETLEA
jgi:glyoxylase-like metal-dependent hydrolase (beta-lactamase superfamily II)